MKNNDFQELIHLLYEVSTDIDRWGEIADELNTLFGCSGIAVIRQPLPPSGRFFVATSYFEQTPANRHFEDSNTPETDIGLAAVPNIPANMPSFVILFRRAGQPDSDETDLEKPAELPHHIRKTQKSHRLLSTRDQERQVAMHRAPLSHIAHGLLTLDMEGKVLDTDAGADAILKEHSGLKLRDGKLLLEATDPPVNGEDLQAFIEEPAQHAATLIIRTRDEAVIVLKHMSAPAGDTQVSERLCRFLTIRRIRTHSAPETVILSKAYGLTRAESRVVNALSYSDNAAEAARAIGIKRDTMKSHLTKIYGKAGVNSLPQLMLLIGKLS